MKLEKIEKIVGDVYCVRHSYQPCARETMERMEKYQVIHFACNGRSILDDPLSSHLNLLQATNPLAGSTTPVVDKLTVQDLAALNLTCGKLA